MPEPKQRYILTHKGVELLLDSGAFTAFNIGETITLPEYLAFLRAHRRHLFGYMALDVLQNPDATATNLTIMRTEGFHPIPVHVFGDDQAKMDELFSWSEWVALGGFRRPHRGAAPAAYVKEKMGWATGRKVHWLGYASDKMLRAFRPYSCDVSSWASGAMYGRVPIYLGHGKWVSYTLQDVREKKPYLRGEVAAALDWYGITPDELLDERHWHNGNRKHELRATDCLIVKLPARSWVRYGWEMRTLFGPRVFLATVPELFRAVMDAAAAVRERWMLEPHRSLI
jgi:hypothetical protein